VSGHQCSLRIPQSTAASKPYDILAPPRDHEYDPQAFHESSATRRKPPFCADENSAVVAVIGRAVRGERRSGRPPAALLVGLRTGLAGAAADVSLIAAKSVLVKPEQRAALERTGSVLRGMRETAGMSVKEVGDAIDLKDPTLLDLVEHGKAALPFEIILRLASVLGRNDPISFVMRFTRSYNPEVWKTLENLGIGRFVVQAGREREFANIYRGSDAARRLSDEEFAAILGFTKAAFDLAMVFRANHDTRSAAKRPKRPTSDS
jgi:transcriptional regulator with XRE-family HTH domain